jgi:NADPH:quinone reductase-like Zn-dependent oxidoreductase
MRSLFIIVSLMPRHLLAGVPTQMQDVKAKGRCTVQQNFSCIREQSGSVPKASNGKALVEMKGTSVNPVDCDLVEAGFSFGILGSDGAGTVVSVGSGCDLKVGDEVYGAFTGAYAQYAVGSCTKLAKKPKSLSFAEAGTIPMAAGTSLQALQAAGMPSKKANLTVAVTSGQGGTGFMGVQLAKAMGAAHVITAATGEGIDFVKSLGADIVTDYHQQSDMFASLPDNSVDIVYDNYGTKGTADRAMHAIKPGGVYLVISSGGGGAISKHPKAGVRQINFGIQSSGKKEYDYVAGLFDAGALKAHIFASYGLAEVPKAWSALRGHGVLGKISIDQSKGTAPALVV